MSKIKAYTGDEPYIFISYAHADTVVQDLLYDLANKNYRFWYDEGIKSGRAWADEIADRIKNCTQFVVFLSNNAVKSENIKDEIHLAIKYKINMLIIHLENIVLDGGLELQLDRLQALLRDSYDTINEFETELFRAIDPNTVKPFDNGVTIAKEQLQELYELMNLRSVDNISKTYYAIRKSAKSLVVVKQIFIPEGEKGEPVRFGVREGIHMLRITQDCPFTPYLIDTFEDEKNIFIVTSCCFGEFLSSLIRDMDRTKAEPLQEQCVKIAISIAEGLEYLHNAEKAVVHRDIKPDNIIITSMNHAIIEDLDLCKTLDGSEYPVLGTKGYAAPEQYHGLEDCRADIYALGVTLLEMLTECKPRDIDTFDIDCPLRVYNSGFSPALEQIIKKMTAFDAELRYQSVEQVLDALRNIKLIEKQGGKRLLRESNEGIKAYKKKWERYQAALNDRTASLIALENEPLPLLCNDSRSVTLKLDYEQFLVEEELRNCGIPEENRLYSDTPCAGAFFKATKSIKNTTPVAVEFEILDAENINALTIYLNHKPKNVSIRGSKYSVLFDTVPSLLAISRNESLIKVDGVRFSYEPANLMNIKKPAKLTITNVTIRKAQ